MKEGFVMDSEVIQIKIPCALITLKSAAWNEKSSELCKASQEAIRYAVQNNPNSTKLKQWLESRTKLILEVEFHLNSQRVHKSDIDSLLASLLNPVVEGACGSRPAGKPIPQTKDSLFWKINATKLQDNDEKTLIKVKQL